MVPISLAVSLDMPLVVPGLRNKLRGACWVAISPIGSGSRWSATRGGLCGGCVGLAISPIGSVVVGCGFGKPVVVARFAVVCGFSVERVFGLMELRIRRRELLAVPIDFMSPCGHSQSWNDWVDKELQDDEFVSCLRRADIYSAVLLSRGSDMYRDIQGLRQLVRCWNLATHTFFLAWGEVTITLEDIERILLLPYLGDNDPTAINLTVEETRWEDALYLGFGGREASPGGQKARLNYWIQHFQNHPTCWVRRSAFVVYWLSRYAFDETPSYSIKPFLFELGIKLAQGMSYPLGALCLGNLYIHLNRLHDDEVEGSPYHAVESSVNVTLLQVFVMEHLHSFASHAKTPKAVRDRVLRSLGDGKGFLSKFSGGFPILFKWVGVKASEVSWMDDLDDEVKFVWRPYVKVKEGFACPNIFPAAPFRDGYSSCFFKDGNLKFCTFLAAITPAWLPTFGENGMETIHYNPHRVRRQFGLDQDVPSANVVVFDCDTVIAPLIVIRATKYWFDLSVRVTIPTDMRVGNLTSHMYRYWDRLNEAFAKYVKSGYDTISISKMPKIPLTNPRFKPYSLSLTTYSRKEGYGFAEWDAGCHSWIMHGKAMSSRCQEAEFALLAMPLKQGKTVALATSSTNSTNSEGSNKKARENDDTNPSSRILGKAKAGDSADLRRSKPVVLAICAAPVGSNVIASSLIVIDEGSSLPLHIGRRVYIPEVIERDDSSNTSNISDHDDTSIQEVPLRMAPPATADIPESAAHSQENDLNTLLKFDTVANVFTTAIVEKVTDNTRSSEVDLAIQRCGETPHGVSSPLIVGVAALGNTHPCHLNFGSAHSLAVNIVKQDTPVSIIEKNDFDLIQGDFGSFLSRLNETRANLCIASHFWSFSEAKENFLHFSIPAEAVPLLEKLLLKHGNFMGGFKLGMGFGDFSLALLAAVLMDIDHTPFDLLDEGKLFEWMDAVRDLITTGVAVGFLLDHIRNLGEMWFAQKEKKKQLTSISSKIAKMEEELLALKSEWE
uniref:Aminotransferase-like plant mobile domain-containing protein n=1 Tax=Fagus sylvatica TaxID=28930 RepID=A0A2N9E1E4_FAGSY